MQVLTLILILVLVLVLVLALVLVLTFIKVIRRRNNNTDTTGNTESPHSQAPALAPGGALRIVGATPTPSRIEVARAEDADP